MRGHCCMSPARREAVFWAADAAIGVATAETAAPDATSRRVKVPGLISGNESQFFCERAAVFAATATSKMRRGILLRGSQLMGLRAPKDWARHSPDVSLNHAGSQTERMAEHSGRMTTPKLDGVSVSNILDSAFAFAVLGYTGIIYS